MAELLNKIPTNLTEYPNSFKRQGAFPLEAYSVFYTMEAAENYASSNPIAYVGQTLAVVTANAEDASVVDSVVFYIIADATGTLQEVGKATAGDGKTIDLDAESGVLSLHGLEGKSSGTYVPTLVNGELTWAEPLNSTVEGLEASIAALQTTVGKAADGDKAATGLVKAVADNAQAIADEKSAREAAIGKATEGEVAATGIYAAIEAAEARAKQYADDNDSVYDETALANRVSVVESDVADHETRIVEVEKFFKVTGEDKINEALDTLIEIQKEIAADDTSAAAMLSSINANTAAIGVLNGDVNTSGSVDKKIATAIEPLATKTALSEVNALAAAAATKSYVDTELAKRATVSSVNELSTAISNLGDTYYTEDEVDSFIANITGENHTKTIKDLEDELSAHKTAYSTKIGELAQEDADLASDIAKNTTLAQQGVDNAAKAQKAADDAAQAVTNLSNGQVNTNKTAIASLTTIVSGASAEDTNSHAYKIGQLETKLANHANDYSILNGKVAENSAEIAKKADASKVYEKGEVDNFLAAKANASDVYTTSQVYTKDEVDTSIKSATDALKISEYAKTTYVDGEIDKVEAEVAKKVDKSVYDEAIANVYTKTEADNKFMTEDEVATYLNTVIDGANSGDTITNVKTLIEYVNTNGSSLTGLTSRVTTAEGEIDTLQSDVAELKGKVHPKASTEISVANDGTLGIIQLDVSKLVQTDVLILNGGTAQA